MTELKDKAETGDAYSMRQLYLRYAMAGKAEQAQAWAARYLEAVEEKARNNDIAAARYLGKLYMQGEGPILPDREKGIARLTQASEGGDAASAYLLGELMTQAGNAEAAKINYARAYGLYKQQAADGNNAEALCCQGFMELNGTGTPANAAEGLSHLQQAADMGNMDAVAQLFKAYESGKSVPADAARALEYAKVLADKGKQPAMAYLVADAYFKGTHLPQDDKAAERYLEQAVAGNVPQALYHKAWRLEQAGNSAAALQLYRNAAAAGHTGAMVKAGTLLLYGAKGGVEKDDATGLNYLNAADARYEDAAAAYELGRYYDSIGESALADERYITASDRGLAEAMVRRGWLHLNPFSPAATAWNPTATYRWWKRGADAGNADCTLHYRLYIFCFIPLLLLLVFGAPIAALRYAMKEK